MSCSPLFLLLAGVVVVALAAESETFSLKKELDRLSQQMKLQQLSTEESLQALKADLENERTKYQNILGGLTRQVMMQQLSTEESLRAGGDSGIKQTRNQKIGTRAYYSSTHSNARSVNAIHDHSQNIQTVGMGELVAVMNGVEFRTRHNDFPLRQPHHTDTGYDKTEVIEYPPVPPSITPNMTIKDQVAEMKEWFKAWRDQDTTKRDYRPYFKPIMCYLEGAWTQAGEKIDEPFESDRHFVDASTWWDLLEKVRFTGYSGSKSNQENYSFLPMKIMNLINNNTEPVWAQWNYRIVCAHVQDIPTRFLRPIDDLSTRMMNQQSLEEYAMTRRARFFLHNYFVGKEDQDKSCHWCYIDSVMEQIPGKDNYNGHIEDNAFGNYAVSAGGENAGKNLNTAYYHRYFKSSKKGAMGTVMRMRGFSDRQLYMAQTTQPKIPSMKVTDCQGGVCTDYEQRWTYAIPLEIIYLTPLFHWNPYNISIATKPRDPRWKKVDGKGRNGRVHPDKAYDGNRNNIYYHTPEELFMGAGEVEKDPADTSKGVVGVLDPEGNVCRVVASGTRIFLPNMPGVGTLRTRYPISPIYNEGSQVYKELESLKDLVLRKSRFEHMFYEKSSEGAGSGGNVDPIYQFDMALATRDPPGLHTHVVDIPGSEVKSMMTEGTKYVVESDIGNGHSHELVVRYDKNASHPWVVQSCDGAPTCWDEHPLFLEFAD